MASCLFIFAAIISLTISLAQSQSPVPAPPPAADSCNGIFLTYAYTSGRKIPPDESDPSKQPYRFQSTLTVLNNGADELKSWQVFVGFQHDEYLVSASNAVLADGTTFPALVGNGTVFAGYPSTDLKTAIETAGDVTQMSVQIDLLGTQFGVAAPAVPMPSNISLANAGFLCPRPTMQGRNEMQVCCTKDPNFEANVTIDEEFLPRQDGDLTIMYDITRTYDTNYFAQVTISNHNPLGRLDNWKLSWDWMRDEFIFGMRGAYPSIRDSSDCIFGPQGEFYKQMDFSTVLNCERRPTLVDLPLAKTNDTEIGMVPFCCRNGTILPRTMDPAKSTSAFQLNVFKMPPDLNRSQLSPPQNWQISGRLNPDYKCGPPVRVSPTQFPDPAQLLSDTAAIASWQVVCNITQHKGASPRCCVSFSAYYNESIIPCKTCACGCSAARTCSATSPALFLPSQALLVPFENRTAMAVAWANLKRRAVPSPLPCGDNCGVSLNWHLFTDYRGGWSARLTVFNWDDEAFVDWFAAVEMKETAALGFERAYSFNGSALEGVKNNTIFMQGLEGLNYLVGESDAARPDKDPRVPGKQQSVISFTKKNIPGINVVGGDGFPSKVFFNGEECSLPDVIPTSNSFRLDSAVSYSTLLAVFVIILLQHR